MKMIASRIQNRIVMAKRHHKNHTGPPQIDVYGGGWPKCRQRQTRDIYAIFNEMG